MEDENRPSGRRICSISGPLFEAALYLSAAVPILLDGYRWREEVAERNEKLRRAGLFECQYSHQPYVAPLVESLPRSIEEGGIP